MQARLPVSVYTASGAGARGAAVAGARRPIAQAKISSEAVARIIGGVLESGTHRLTGRLKEAELLAAAPPRIRTEGPRIRP